MFGSSQWMYNSGSTYNIEKSLKFTPDSSNSLYRTFSSGNRKTWTWSGWLKRSRTFEMFVFGASNGTNNDDNYTNIQFFDGRLNFSNWTGSINVTCYPEYLDSSQWIHVVCKVDTTQESSEDRIVFYVNGARQPLQTSKQPEKDQQLVINKPTRHNIGERVGASTTFWDGYMAEIHFIDGQALDPTNFGKVNEDYGNWEPIKYTGGNYGTNGFYLPFTNSPFYHDMSGNNNNFTAQNFATYDVVPDTPTNNFATFSREDKVEDSKLENGNLRSTGVQGQIGKMTSTISVSSGAWYFEVRAGTLGSTGDVRTIGIYHDGTRYATNDGNFWAQDGSKGFGQRYNFNVGYRDGSNIDDGIIDDSNFWEAGAIYGFAFDINNDIIRFYKNGTLRATVNSAGLGAYDNWVAAHMMECNSVRTPAQNWVWNFGQDSSFEGFTTGQGNTDANGVGDFHYSPPSGHLAMCSRNLPDPAVKPQENFNTVLYAGNSSTQTINGVGFQSDFSWIKRRNGSGQDHVLQDIVRGFTSTTKLSSSSDQGENDTTSIGGAGITDPQWGYISSVTSDGLNVTVGSGSGDQVNRSGMEYIAWNWKAGGSGVSNTSGNVTSTVSANPNAGFSIVTYTGNANNGQTIGHGLGTTPDWIIVKKRTNASPGGLRGWAVYSSKLPTDNVLRLNSQSGAFTEANFFREDLMNSSVFGVNADYDTGWSDNYVAYCFSEREGFSKVGKYTGNGSADGPFIHCGFRPAFVLIKRQNTTQAWVMVDNKRSAYNPGGETMFAEATDGEYESLLLRYTDFTANGFKIRAGIGTERNDNGSTYAFIAFAEQPFKHSNARGSSYDKETSVAPSVNTIGQSLRLADDDSAYLSRTLNASDRKTWTFSTWLKRGEVDTGSAQYIMHSYDGSSGNRFAIRFSAAGNLEFDTGGSGSVGRIDTLAQFKDASCWYHIVVVCDTTNSRNTERQRIYVNGELQAVSIEAQVGQDFSGLCNAGLNHQIGSQTGSQRFDGYLADTRFIDGQALGPEHFGYTDPTYGDWRPKDYDDNNPEANYGPNGFRLTYNSGSARIDQSGMGNHWTVNNFSETIDSLKDSPTNNYCTWNPIDTSARRDTLSSTRFEQGNLKVLTSEGVDGTFGTIALSNKWNTKYYYEVRINSIGSGIYAIGLGSEKDDWDNGVSGHTTAAGGNGKTPVISSSGPRMVYNSTVYSNWNPGFTTGDIIGVAIDLSTESVYFSKNGAWMNGSGGTTTFASAANASPNGLEDVLMMPFVSEHDNSNVTANFGQDPSFAGAITAGTNVDSSGYGTFKHAPPSGYVAICTNNLPNPDVVPRENMNVMLYSGDGSSNHKITGVGFKPSMVWLKRRDAAGNHRVYDATTYGGPVSAGGTTYFTYPNLDSQSQGSSTNTLISLDDDGFTVTGAGGETNAGGANYTAYCWAGPSTLATLTGGTINSSASVNASAGISMVNYTGNGVDGATVAHGLNSKPKFIATRNLSSSGQWNITAPDLIGDGYWLRFNATDGPSFFDSTWSADANNIILSNGGGHNTSGYNYVSYVFAEVPGFSAFGVYTGRGDTNGSFINCGFRPEFVLYKKLASEVWYLVNEDSGYNGNMNGQYIHDSVVEYNSNRINLYSNGFKCVHADSDTGQSGAEYMYMAFAKNPFKFTNAR